MKIVKVTWDDAGGKPGWFDYDEIIEWLVDCVEHYEVVTTGYLYIDEEDYIVLIRGYSGLGGMMDPIRIMKTNITKMTELQEVTSD